jgi:hypothetical protein
VAFALSHLGQLARESGDDASALRRFADGSRVSQEIGDSARMAECLEGFAGALTAADPAMATRIMAAAATLRRELDSPLPSVHHADHERDVARLRAALGNASFEGHWTAGTELPLAEAMRRLEQIVAISGQNDAAPCVAATSAIAT